MFKRKVKGRKILHNYQNHSFSVHYYRLLSHFMDHRSANTTFLELCVNPFMLWCCRTDRTSVSSLCIAQTLCFMYVKKRRHLTCLYKSVTVMIILWFCFSSPLITPLCWGFVLNILLSLSIISFIVCRQFDVWAAYLSADKFQNDITKVPLLIWSGLYLTVFLFT